ncbi:ABC transporter ATP-binding protein [Candidatus Berkelbacteria bacterium]|nr:ABC transporter ATP-binding protein [Candidatus Berkelbacteria bacterium]
MSTVTKRLSANHSTPPPIVHCERVSKVYGSGTAATTALNEITFDITAGTFTAITGPSGSGKSTLLNLLGLLDRPSSGTLSIDGRDVNKIVADSDRARVRRELIGFIFQQFMLLPKATALENVLMPGVYSRLQNREERAKQLLKDVGLSHRLDHRPNQLSGGELQRVAIARSLLNDPKILLADEPTGNLDSKTGAQILRLLQDFNKSGKTLIIVTHDSAIAKFADHVISVKDGQVQ